MDKQGSGLLSPFLLIGTGGTLAVLEILKYFDALETMISLSDLLEGVLFDKLGYSLPGENT